MIVIKKNCIVLAIKYEYQTIKDWKKVVQTDKTYIIQL